MAATITDKFSKVSTGVRPLTTTVDGTRATSGATLTCADLTGWDTDTAVHGVTYKVDGQGAIVAGSQLDFKGIVSGNTITNFTVTGGTDAGNAVGDIVQATPTAAWAKDLADGLVAEHNEDGTHNFTDAFTDLTALTSADSTDVVPLVDVSTNTTKKTTVAGLTPGLSGITNSQLSTTAGELGGAWTSWTPTFNLVGGGSWGNGVLTGGYTKVGKRVRFWAKFMLGTTTNFSGLTNITLNLPFTASASYPYPSVIGAVHMTSYYNGVAIIESTTVAGVYGYTASGTYLSPIAMTPTVPFAWANTNYAVVTGDYEAA